MSEALKSVLSVLLVAAGSLINPLALLIAKGAVSLVKKSASLEDDKGLKAFAEGILSELAKDAE